MPEGACDLSGATLQYAPENKASAYAEYFADDAVNGWDLSARLDVSYTDDHFTDVGLFDFTFTKAYSVLGASIRLISPDENTTISLIGRNLGNEKINAWDSALRAKQYLCNGSTSTNICKAGYELLRFKTIVTPPAGSPKFKKGTRPDAGLC